jgi:excisionase family DNA binding protein
MAGLTVSPEMVRMNTAYDSDCAKAVWDYVRRWASEGKTVHLDVSELTYTPAEVADLVGVSRPTIQRAITSGTIKAARHGNRWRISKDEVDRYRLYLADQMAELVADDLDF